MSTRFCLQWCLKPRCTWLGLSPSTGQASLVSNSKRCTPATWTGEKRVTPGGCLDVVLNNSNCNSEFFNYAPNTGECGCVSTSATCESMTDAATSAVYAIVYPSKSKPPSKTVLFFFAWPTYLHGPHHPYVICTQTDATHHANAALYLGTYIDYHDCFTTERDDPKYVLVSTSLK